MEMFYLSIVHRPLSIKTMIILVKTNSENEDFKALVKLLDAHLAVTDGDEHAFYNQFNKITHIKHVIVAYENEKPVGCGAIKTYDPDTVEIKRMFVLPEMRGKGIAGIILEDLETWAKELGFDKFILETGKRQIEAIALYKKSGYRIIPNYGQYEKVENSVCFEKKL